MKVTTSDSCKIVIEDLTEYVSEDTSTVSKDSYKYSETVSIDLLQINGSSETTYTDPVITTHDTTESITLPVSFDGWFTVTHIILPTKEWFYEMYEKYAWSGKLSIGYDIIYFSDGETIYKYVSGDSVSNITEVTVEELVEINPDGTNISIIQKDYVSICYLRKCYIDLCKQIFESRGMSSCWNNSDIDSELVFKRDLVWMAINVIRYLTECNQLAEVQRIIENIRGCNGLCGSSTSTSKTSGCGCGK